MRIHAIARVSTLYPGYPFAVLCTARVAVLLSSRCAALSWPFIWLGIHRPVVMLMVYRESDRMLIVCRVPCADFRVLERVRQRTDMAVSSPVYSIPREAIWIDRIELDRFSDPARSIELDRI